MKTLIRLLLPILALAACQRHESGHHLGRWPESTAQIDSMTQLLERWSILGCPADSIEMTIDRLRSIDNPEARLRAEFFTARTLRRLSREDEALYLVYRLKASIDSASAPYLTARLNYEISQSLEDYQEKYLSLINNLGYFEAIQDTFMIACAENSLGLLYRSLGNGTASFKALTRAQQLFSDAGLRDLWNHCNINLISLFEAAGDSSRVDSLYSILLADPGIKDIQTREIILRNYSLHYNDMETLQQAVALTEAHEEMTPIRPLSYNIMAQFWMERGQADSAIYYAHRSHDLYGDLQDPNYRANCDKVYSQALQLEGKNDSAIIYLTRFMETMDSLMILHDSQRVRTLETNLLISRYETEAREKRIRERFAWLLGLMAIAIVAVGGLFIFYRSKQRSEMDRINARLELEKLNRTMAARSLSMEETDNMLSETRRKLAKMADDGQIKQDAARELDNMIKMHNTGKEDWKNFEMLFEKVNPEFTRALRERCPDLGETNTKMAMYLYMGMSNKQIARILMIRLESVRQARWRLRRKLGIPGDQSLEASLRALPD